MKVGYQVLLMKLLPATQQKAIVEAVFEADSVVVTEAGALMLYADNEVIKVIPPSLWMDCERVEIEPKSVLVP